MTSSSREMDEHMLAYERAWRRFPNLPEKVRAEWAERIANNIAMQMLYSTTGPVLIGKFEAADYLDDGRSPLRPGGDAR